MKTLHAVAAIAALIAPVTGYLMVRRGGVWQRLVVIDPIKGPGDAG